MSTEDARSDVILAAAATLFGGFVASLVVRLPLYPRFGLLALLLGLFWIFALTGLVPLLLSRYRGDRMAAFGLDVPPATWRAGLLVALPVVALGLLRELVVVGSATAALLGRIGGSGAASPVIGGPTALVPLEMVLGAAQVAVMTLGGVLLMGFLAVRGGAGLRAVDLDLTAMLRTYGVGAAAVALVLGALRAISPQDRVVPVLLHVAALLVLVLLADRQVPAGHTVPRGLLLAPVVVVALMHVFAAGGLFRGDLITGLYTGALAVGTTLVLSALVGARRGWGLVPLLLALHWWPSCLSPLAFDLAC